MLSCNLKGKRGLFRRDVVRARMSGLRDVHLTYAARAERIFCRVCHQCMHVYPCVGNEGQDEKQREKATAQRAKFPLALVGQTHWHAKQVEVTHCA